MLHYELIPDNPYLQTLRAKSSLILDHVIAYALDDCEPHPLVKQQWADEIAEMMLNAEHILAEVYETNLEREDLTQLVEGVTMGMSLDDVVEIIREINEGELE